MRQNSFRRRIPVSWHTARVPVPPGEAVASYAERLQRYTAGQRMRRAWAWTYDGERADHIILAAPRMSNLPVLLAFVVVLNRWTRVADELAEAA